MQNQKGTSSEKKTLISIDKISKIYTRERVKVSALNNFSAEFYQGEISVIIGPSGCGKTTLLNVLGGLIEVSSGKVLIDNKNLAEMDEKALDYYRSHEIGYIFQFFNLISELTAFENIQFPMEIKGFPNNEVLTKANELLAYIGLEDRRNHYPNELSGGEQQRIAIAMALSKNPRILLCDEPTGELDSHSKRMVMKIFKKIIQEYPDKSIIIVSHDPEMRYIADRIYHIKDGQITYITVPDEKEKEKFNNLLINEESDFQMYDEELEHELQETIFYLKNKLTQIKK